MPTLTINATINLTDEEAAAVADALGCTVPQLQAKFAPYAPAAMREYLDMFGGQAMTSVSDARDRRLLAILLALADFPSDETIARLFSLTGSAARALLRTTLSRHRNRLKGVVLSAGKKFLAACNQAQPGGDWEARYPSSVLVEILNGQLAAATQPRAPIRRKPGTFDTYVVANGAKNELAALYP
jgi:hypothetical protein